MKRILVAIALRNVLRHGKRTLITAIVMTVGIGMFIFFDAILAGMDRMTIDSMVDYSNGSVAVMTPEYRKDKAVLPLDRGIPDPESVIGQIAALAPRAEGIAPRTDFLAYASNYVDGKPVRGTALDPLRDPDVFSLRSGIVAGGWISSAREVLIGRALAAELKVEAGDWIILQASTVDDRINADEFMVAGILDVPVPEVNDSGVFLGFEGAKTLLGEALPVSVLHVALPREGSLDAELQEARRLGDRIESGIPGLAAEPVGEAARDYLAMRSMKAKYSMLIILVVLLIAGVGIVNTILMSVYSRVREIGVLRAYGMGGKDIRRLFSLEGLMIGIVGSLGGAVFGAILVWWSMRFGIPLDKMIGKIDLGPVPLPGALFGEFHPQIFLLGMLFGILASWVAAGIPARKAARLEVTDALRFV